jgi:hypothetical protein
MWLVKSHYDELVKQTWFQLLSEATTYISRKGDADKYEIIFIEENA